MAGSCEHGNEPSASTNAGNFVTSRGTVNTGVEFCFLELFTWLVGWLVGQSVSWLVGRSVSQSVGWLVN